MPFNLLIVFVIDMLKFIGYCFADVTLEMRRRSFEMILEGIDIVKPLFTEITVGMIKGQFPML